MKTAETVHIRINEGQVQLLVDDIDLLADCGPKTQRLFDVLFELRNKDLEYRALEELAFNSHVGPRERPTDTISAFDELRLALIAFRPDEEAERTRLWRRVIRNASGITLLALLKQSADTVQLQVRPNHPRVLCNGRRVVTQRPVAENLPTGTRNPSNVPLRNHWFTGREQLLRRISEAVATGIPQALVGPPGIGKTQTLIEFAHRDQAVYRALLWVRAASENLELTDASEPEETATTISSSFAHLATVLDLPEKDQGDEARMVKGVRDWLRSNTGWLLIFDNVDDIQDAFSYFPEGGGGHILISSRDPAVIPIAQPIALDEMDATEGATFLLRRAGLLDLEGHLDPASTQHQHALAVVAEVSGIPLALDQAGAYMEERSLSPDGYLSLFQTHAKTLLEFAGRTPQHASVATTVSMAFGRVADINATAADLLQVCAFLASAPIPEVLFSQGAAELGPALAAAFGDDMHRVETTAAACYHSLLRRDPHARTLTMHRLVQLLLRESLAADSQALWAKRAILATDRAWPPLFRSDPALRERLLPHAVRCAEWIKSMDAEFVEAAHLLYKTGLYYGNRASHADARPLLLHARTLYRRLGDELGAANTSNLLGWGHRVDNHLPEAQLYFEESYAGFNALYERPDDFHSRHWDDLIAGEYVGKATGAISAKKHYLIRRQGVSLKNQALVEMNYADNAFFESLQAQVDGDHSRASDLIARSLAHCGRAVDLFSQSQARYQLAGVTRGVAEALNGLGIIEVRRSTLVSDPATQREHRSMAGRYYDEGLALRLAEGSPGERPVPPATFAYLLENVAELATAEFVASKNQASALAAARLYGVADRLRSVHHAPRPDVNLPRYNHNTQALINGLGLDRYDTERAEGETMTPEHGRPDAAIHYAFRYLRGEDRHY